jgi:hypothetical protein
MGAALRVAAPEPRGGRHGDDLAGQDHGEGSPRPRELGHREGLEVGGEPGDRLRATPAP